MEALIIFFLYTTSPADVIFPSGHHQRINNYLHCIGPLNLAAAQERLAQKVVEYKASKPGDMSEPVLIKQDDPRFAGLSVNCRD